jgi:O-antigen biosynthesis protein
MRSISFNRAARRSLEILKGEGAFGLAKRVVRKIKGQIFSGPGGSEVPFTWDEGDYPAWIEQNEPGESELKQQVELSGSFYYQPLISVLMPVFNPDPHVLREAILSVLAQTYPFWELCIVDAGSDRPGVKETLQEFAQCDERIHQIRLNKNAGISANTNAALEAASGEYAALLDHDDLLAPFALYEVASKLNDDLQIDLLYSDHDLLSAGESRRCSPLFKPDWSPDIMLSANYITHLTVLRTSLIRELGGFDPSLDGAQDWDLFLKVSERTQNIAHISKVLYHWRDSQSSTADDIWAKAYAPPAQLRAVQAHLERRGLKQARSMFDATGYIRVAWEMDRTKLVSIIIPSNGANELLENAVTSIFDKTSYPTYEVLVVNNGPNQPETFPFYEKAAASSKFRVVHDERPFNYSAANNYGAQHARGDFLLFLNNDIEVITSDWLDELVMWAARTDVGAVGGKLLTPDGRIQHAGVIVGLTGYAGHIFGGLPENRWSIFGLAEWYRDYLALTGACLILRTEVFRQAGGFDENLSLCGNDVELCLRLRRLGLQVAYNPFVRMKHIEGATRLGEVPVQDYLESYPHYLPALTSGDPYFNPNLSYWSLAPRMALGDEQKPLDFVEDHLERLKGSSKHAIK